MDDNASGEDGKTQGMNEEKLRTRLAFQYSQMLERADEPNLAPERKLILSMELMAYGLVDKSRQLLQSIFSGAERDRRLDFLDRVEAGEKVLSKVIAAEAAETGTSPLIHPQIDPRGGRRLTGVLIAPQQQPVKQAVLIFGGNADRNFPISPPILEITNAHVIMIKDPSRCFGLCDIPRLGKDFEANIARMKRILKELGVEKLYSLGFSSGGFAAMKFALALEAEGVLCFSSPTSLDIEDEPGSSISKYPQLALLYRKARHLGTSMVREYNAKSPHPGVILVFGAEHARDKYFAEHMAPVAGVELEPLSGHQLHATFIEAVSRGMFASLFARMLAKKPVASNEKAPLFVAAE